MSGDQPDLGGFAPRSRLGRTGLFGRRLVDIVGTGALVAVLTACVAALMAGAPAGYARMAADELGTSLEAAGPLSRHLISVASADPAAGPSAGGTGSADEPDPFELRFGFFTEQLAGLRETFPEPLRGQIGAADWAITMPPVYFTDADPDTDPAGATQIVVARAVPDPAAHADLVAGSWPVGSGSGGDDGGGPVEIAISTDAAAHLGWDVGEQHAPFVISGIYHARNADDDYWALNPGMVLADVFDDGDRRPSITVTGFVSALDVGGAQLKIWYPIDLAGLTGGQAGEILGQLRGVTARTNTLAAPVVAQPAAVASLTLTAAAIPVLEDATARLATARSVLIVAVIGPLGAAVAVLLLGSAALAARRQAGESLLAVRGASTASLRRRAAADGLVFGVPAGILGVLAVLVGFPDAPVGALVAGLLVGLVPAAALLVAPVHRTLASSRPDVTPHRQARLRWLIDLGVCGLAAISTYLLLTVGVASPAGSGEAAGSAGTGTDILVAAAPLLLAGAACVVVLRVYPVPLRRLVTRLHRSRSAVAFLGAVRGLRDPAVRVAPVLAVVTGVSLAVFSATTLSTIRAGTATAAVEQLGGPLRLSGPLITDARLAQLRELPGVTVAARLEQGGIGDLEVDGARLPTRTTVYLADTAALAQVQEALGDALPDGPVVPAGGLDADPQRPAQVLTSPGLFPAGASDLTVGGRQVTTAGTAERVPGFQDAGAWVLADIGSGIKGNGARTVILVPETTEPAALARLEASVTAITGEGQFQTPADLEALVVADPANAGVRTALLVAVGVAALAAGAAVVLTLVLNARSRARLLTILQVLGMSGRDRRRLVAWEQVPTAAVALLVGTLLGIGVTVLVRQVVDLRPFTGGRRAPDLVIDPAILGGLLIGFVAVVGLAIAVGTALSRRTSASVATRLDQE